MTGTEKYRMFVIIEGTIGKTILFYYGNSCESCRILFSSFCDFLLRSASNCGKAASFEASLYPRYCLIELFISSVRFKNVMFEIKSADEVGVFEVSAKFMGVAMEKVELVFQVRKL